MVNPCILNVITGERIRILTTLTQEQTIEIYRTTTDQLAVKRTEHQVEENIFALLDEDSDLVELAPVTTRSRPRPTATWTTCKPP